VLLWLTLCPHGDVACRTCGRQLREGKPAWLPYIASLHYIKTPKLAQGFPWEWDTSCLNMKWREWHWPSLFQIWLESINPLMRYNEPYTPRPPPCLMADLYGRSIRQICKANPGTQHVQDLHCACPGSAWGGACRWGWGLVWLIHQRNSSHSYYFALFSEVTWHLGHVIDLKHSL
jgi:hypothetical protein